jgi:hypothetical protein
MKQIEGYMITFEFAQNIISVSIDTAAIFATSFEILISAGERA